MVTKKKFTRSWLQKFKKKIKLIYEWENYFISFKLINLKKKKKSIQPTQVKYLKTARYVIPLPSEEDDKKKVKKKLLLIKTNLESLYNYYNDFFEWWLYQFNFSPITTYVPGKLTYLTKFDHNLKLEILFFLNNVFWLFIEPSFSKNYLRWYYSSKRFKIFSLIFFRDMFEYYRNPNLPLKRRRGERPLTKTQGTSLLQAWEIIFKELSKENLGLPHFFSETELKIFWQANVDPFDKRYHWPTRWLFILNLSKHDGWIFPILFNQIKPKFSKIKPFLISKTPKSVLLNLKKKILLQFFFWKFFFLKLLGQNWLLFKIKESYNIFKFDNINNFIPAYYFGYKNDFFLFNFLQNYTNNFNFWINSYTFLIKKLLSLNINNNVLFKSFFFKKLWFFIGHKKNRNYIKILTRSQLGSVMKFKSIRVKNNLGLFNFEDIFKIKKTKITPSNKFFFAIPPFLKLFFFFIFLNKVNNNSFENFLMDNFLFKLPIFKELQKKYSKLINKPYQPFKFYLTLAFKHNLSNPTIAYWILKNNFNKNLTKNFLVYKPQIFGLNPFYEFSKLLTVREVPFPEAINTYTFFKYLWKKNSMKFYSIHFFFLLNRFLIFSLPKIILLMFKTPRLLFYFNLIIPMPFFWYFIKKKAGKNLFVRIVKFLNISIPSFLKKKGSLNNYKSNLNYIDFYNDALLELQLYPQGWNTSLLTTSKMPKQKDIWSKKAYWLKIDYLWWHSEKSKTYYLINTMYPLLNLNFFLWNQYITNSVTNIENYQQSLYISSISLLTCKFFFLPNAFSLYTESFYHYIWMYYCLKHVYITLPPILKLKLKKYV